MTLATTRKWIQQTLRALMTCTRRSAPPDPHDRRHDEPLVFAVTRRYPTRLVLYAAAFQGGWRVHFMKSLREVVKATGTRKPKAVFYDHAAGDPAWDQSCSTLSREGIPFVLLANKKVDETFLVVLASGGYQAWGDPLTSEEIVRAVEFAGEMLALSRVPVA